MEEEDRISLLPDCLLSSIVHLLPPKAAARTMLLSRRWSRIWPSMPLDLNLDSPDSDIRFLTAGSISSILSSHRGAIRRFCVTTLAGVGTHAWLQTLAERRIDDSLALRWAPDLQHPTLPRALLGSAGVSLRRLDLHCCRLGTPNATRSPVPTMPRLDYLYLSNVIISEEALHRMIEACPLLHELRLFMIDGLRRIVFRSLTLAIMNISMPRLPLDEFSVRETPNLESVTFEYVDLWWIPALTVGVGGKVRELGLKLPVVDSPSRNIVPNKSPLPFITSLDFGMEFTARGQMNKAVQMLSLFPCLRRLEIGCFNFGAMNKHGFGEWDPVAETVICLKKHLQHVLFKGFCGTVGEVEFARYLIARAKLLTSMEINHSVEWSLDEISRQKDLICDRGKASLFAQLYFTRNMISHDTRRKKAAFLNSVAMI
ncbi:unnamed protein product [Urochloa decumbens]|uniref:Uncharacterized protein n=1 Tax=Urochloa decumbens TaxID=240449 RepID=A0ABC9F1H2_9POAL